MFTSSDLIDLVRSSLMEFDGKPISNEIIIKKLNLAYVYAYNTLIKANDSLFSDYKYFTIKSGTSSYQLPQDMFMQRIERVWWPTPATDPSNPLAWIEVDRCEPNALPEFQLPRVNVYYPLRWAQLGGKILVAPAPNVSSVFKYQYTKPLIPIAEVQGQIMGIEGNRLTLDRAASSELVERMSKTGMNFISISDERSGHVKALYPYDGLEGETLILSNNFNRSMVKDKKVILCSSFVPASGISYDALTKICTMTLNSNPTSAIKVGDYVEVRKNAQGGYNIVDTLESEDDFYNPAEYDAGYVQFSTKGVVTAVGPFSVSWYDPDVVPSFTNGYPTGYDATFTGALDSMTLDTLYSNPVVTVGTAVPHGLEIGRIFKLDIAGTGTDCDGVQKCIPISATSIAILKPSFAGAFTPLTATWAMYQYSAGIVITGWPVITDLSPGHPQVDIITMYANSPISYTYRDVAGGDTPDEDDIVGNGITGAYNHRNDVVVGDYVTLGYTTAVPVAAEVLSEFLTSYVVLPIKSSLNESDAEVLAILKEKLMEIKSDTDGRNIVQHMLVNRPRGIANASRGRR